ncbi:MAG: twin-arginine translocation signal domain-containing protein [Planctomycetes bacterium]|nr:twin-arginine translocation signal domain-containing protein [Planctomycetota bacterium]NOG52995.1 TIM barrel protein [Planctomycetota bacterium]
MFESNLTRRDFLRHATVGTAVPAVLAPAALFSLWGCQTQGHADMKSNAAGSTPLFRISLAEWSLHRMLRSGELDNLGFPAFARSEFGIDGVEYVNSFFKDKAQDTGYLTELKQRCADSNVRSVLIMCDGEGRLGDPDDAARTTAVENHYRWVEAARFLGCHSIRVNAASEGTYEQQRDLAADGLRRLTEFGAEHDIGVIVENHGGLSSNGQWLSSVIQSVGLPGCGTLPDFGNFCLDWSRSDEADAWYDRYRGVSELMPFAKAVSAKTNDFNEQGDETHTDYLRMMRIVLEAGYRGYVGIEYEGEGLSEVEGIRATHALLDRVRTELAAEYAG